MLSLDFLSIEKPNFSIASMSISSIAQLKLLLFSEMIQNCDRESSTSIKFLNVDTLLLMSPNNYIQSFSLDKLKISFSISSKILTDKNLELDGGI